MKGEKKTGMSCYCKVSKMDRHQNAASLTTLTLWPHKPENVSQLEINAFSGRETTVVNFHINIDICELGGDAPLYYFFK